MTEKLTSEEREALASWFHKMQPGCPHWVTGSFCQAWADKMAESDWLTAHVAAAVAEARESIAREIEAMPRVPHAEYATAFLATRARAAAIARSTS